METMENEKFNLFLFIMLKVIIIIIITNIQQMNSGVKSLVILSTHN